MTARLPDPARSRAVLIGVGRYADPGLAPLPATKNNLTDLQAVLTSAQGTALPPAHCTVVCDPLDAATANRALRQAAAEAEDLLLVYYAGHGLIWSERDELHLAMTGTDLDEVGTSALRCAEVREKFRSSTARTRVLIVDCCFAGRAIGQTMSNPADTVLDGVDVEGVYVLTATEPNQVAKAPQGQRNTLFTGELLDILRTGLPGEQGLITLDLVYRHLKARLHRRGLPEPGCANEKTAAHLALASNAAIRGRPPGRYRKRRESLRTAIRELTEAEERTRRAHELAVDRIAHHGLPPFAGTANTLRTRLATVDGLVADGRLTGVPTELTAIENAVAAIARRAEDAHELAAGLVGRRDELRGRLESYLALAVRLGIAEDTPVDTRYRGARDLLWTRPCDLRAATRAVLAYQKCVTERQETG